MCRLLAYLGEPIQGDRLLFEPEHSLIVQSYQPKEMTAGLLNADGFGIGWYHTEKKVNPYTYKNILPIWSDINLPQMSRYLESPCILAYVRSATEGLPVDLGNCQPFNDGKLLFIHNGYIKDFRQTLYRPIRSSLCDRLYQHIQGTTDSEHIFALILNHHHGCLKEATFKAFRELRRWAEAHTTHFSANIVLSDGQQILASRYAHRSVIPTLYFLQNEQGTILASEPLDARNWQACPPQSLMTISKNRDIHIEAIPESAD